MFTYENVIKRVVRDAAMVAGSVVAAILLIVLINVQIGKAIDNVVAKQQQNASLGLQSDVVSELRGQYLQVQGNETRIRAALLPSSNVLEFVTALESIASKDNVTQAIHFDVPHDAGVTIGDPPIALEQIAFTLSIQGNVFTLIQYLKDLEHLPYFTKVEGISLSASSQGGWQNTSSVQLTGSLYTQNDQ